MNIFITGASGFLGKVVVRRLLEANHQVFALSRSKSSDLTISKTGAKPIRGDLNDIESVFRNLKNIDIAVHCAAPVEFWGPWEKYKKGIVEATVSLANTAAKNGVKRFVHISSESVLQDTESLLDIDESYDYPKEPNSYYGQSKKLAEEFLLKSDFKMEIIIIRPTFIWGAGSNALDTIAKKVKSGQFIWIDQGQASFEAVHVENVAEAIVQSLTKGKNRDVYFVTDDEKSTVKEFFTEIFEKLDLSIPTKSIPSVIAKPIACITEHIWKFAHIPTLPPLTRFDLSFVNMPRRYNITKAKTELEYLPAISRNEGFISLKARTT